MLEKFPKDASVLLLKHCCNWLKPSLILAFQWLRVSKSKAFRKGSFLAWTEERLSPPLSPSKVYGVTSTHPLPTILLGHQIIRTVQERLLRKGMVKYDRLVRFNMWIVGFSLSMDCLIIGMMSLDNSSV
jgi:hypothetical protein